MVRLHSGHVVAVEEWMKAMPESQDPVRTERIGIGSRVIVREGDRRLAGTVFEDFHDYTRSVSPSDYQRTWAHLRRWGVALDDGRLVFVDTDRLELDTSR
jgi:hypothetical protein